MAVSSWWRHLFTDKLLNLLLTLLLILTTEISVGQQAFATEKAAKFIPTEQVYHQFLLKDWRANKPSVLVFKDPFCPYCIRAIPKLQALNDYNVFVFWSPILGQRSINRVNEIFQCERPISANILQAVKYRYSPECAGELNKEMQQLNQHVVDNYKINAVPSYFFQGQRVSLAYLANQKLKHPRINGVAVNWKRYALMKVHQRQQTKSIALIVPEKYSENVQQLIKENKPEFLFLDSGLVTKLQEKLGCQTADNDCIKKRTTLYNHRVEEFKLIFADALPKNKVLVVNNLGEIKTI